MISFESDVSLPLKRSGCDVRGDVRIPSPVTPRPGPKLEEFRYLDSIDLSPLKCPLKARVQILDDIEQYVFQIPMDIQGFIEPFRWSISHLSRLVETRHRRLEIAANVLFLNIGQQRFVGRLMFDATVRSFVFTLLRRASVGWAVDIGWMRTALRTR